MTALDVACVWYQFNDLIFLIDGKEITVSTTKAAVVTEVYFPILMFSKSLGSGCNRVCVSAFSRQFKDNRDSRYLLAKAGPHHPSSSSLDLPAHLHDVSLLFLPTGDPTNTTPPSTLQEMEDAYTTLPPLHSHPHTPLPERNRDSWKQLDPTVFKFHWFA